MDRKLIRRMRYADWDIQYLAKSIDDALLSTGRGIEKIKKESFAPSSIGYMSGTCPRRWRIVFNDEVDYDNTADSVGLLTMDTGTKMHEFLQESLKDTAVLVEAEKEFWHDDPKVHGFIDLVLDVKGTPVLGEIKTTRDESFVHREGKGTPVPYHAYQLLIYMRLLNIENGVLIYINRNSMNIALIPLSLKENLTIVDECLDWMRNVESNSILPTRPFRKNSKECKSCPVLEACKVLPAGEIDISPMQVHKWT